MHARQQLLESVKTLLKNVASPPWDGVYIADEPPSKASWPCLLIRQETEGVTNSDLYGLRRQDRVINIAIHGLMQARQNEEDTAAALNAMAAKIESAMLPSALTAVDDMGMSGTDTLDPSEQGGRVGISLAYWLRYNTREGRPETFGTD